MCEDSDIWLRAIASVILRGASPQSPRQRPIVHMCHRVVRLRLQELRQPESWSMARCIGGYATPFDAG